MPARTDPLLSEGGIPGHEDEALDLIRSLGRPGRATGAGSQRGVIDEIVGRLAESDEIDVGDSLGLKKAGVWALAFDDHRLVGAERLPPPKTE